MEHRKFHRERERDGIVIVFDLALVKTWSEAAGFRLLLFFLIEFHYLKEKKLEGLSMVNSERTKDEENKNWNFIEAFSNEYINLILYLYIT